MFRPCIDLHNGQVKQIVGGSLSDNQDSLKTNFVASQVGVTPCLRERNLISTAYCRQPPAYFANLYKKHNLRGGHIIKLGPGNDDAAKEALQAWPSSLSYRA